MTAECQHRRLDGRRTDVPVLGTAVAGECALLISVDRDLLDMQANSGNSDYSSGRVLAAEID
jgi:hypothetical protein